MVRRRTLTASESLYGAELEAARVPGIVLIWAGDRPTCVPLSFPQSGILIGRDTEQEPFKSDDRLSREHCRVSLEGDKFVVTDLRSTNGTYVNGVRIEGRQSLGEHGLLRAGRSLAFCTQDVRPYRSGVTIREDQVVVGGGLRAAWAEIQMVGRSGNTLCLHGESGSGKELAARAFHECETSSGPFVGVNCAAIPEGVAERLLFGARRGAYSGAAVDVQGYVQAADRGTLFLDEVADLDLRVQAKILRVLETQEVLALGATRPERVQLRVCVAAHADLRELVASGRFREDLYYRVGRPVVRIPPLRERLDELPYILQSQIGRIDPKLVASVRLVEACALRPWPGNVRELIGEARRAAQRALHANRPSVEPADLAQDAGLRLPSSHPPTPAREATPERESWQPPRESSAPPRASSSPPRPSAEEPPEEGRRQPSDDEIERVLNEHAGVVARAARVLGMHRNQLRRWLAKRSPQTASALDDEEDES